MRSRTRAWFRQLALPVVGFAMLAGSLLWGAQIGMFPAWLLGMAACSLVLILAGLLWQEGGSIGDSVTSLTYSLFVLLCAVFLYLIAANHSRRIDLTRFQVNTLSEQTVAMLRSLQTPVRIVAFAETRDHPGLQEFFKLYEQHSDLLVFETYDPDLQIGMARQYDEMVYPGYAYAIAYEDGAEIRRHRFILQPGSERRENILSNAILKAERGAAEKIYFTVGHNERLVAPDESLETGRRRIGETLLLFAQALGQNVMPVETINLARESRVPRDAAMIVVAAPTVDLLEWEREILIEYLNEGGSLMVFIEPLAAAGNLNDLEALLAYVGIEAPNRILIDRYGSPSLIDVLTSPSGDHPIVREAGQGMVIASQARPLELRPDIAAMPTVSIEPLLVTNASVWTLNPQEIVNRREITPPQDPAEIQAFAVAVAATFPTPGGARGSAARVVAFGDVDFLSNARIQAGTPAIVGLHSVNWLAQREDMLAIPPKLIPATTFQIPQGRLFLILGILLLMGLLLLAGGVGYTLARRRMG